MRIVRRLRKNNEYLGYYVLEDDENIKEQELLELEYKTGYYIETYYDKEEDIVKQKYIEIPKTEQELMQEEIIKIKKAIAEQTKDIDLDELETLNSTNRADLSELDTI